MRRERKKPGLLTILREDWRAYRPRALLKPGFHALAVYRFGNAAAEMRRPVRLPLRFLHAGLFFVTRAIYGIELPWQTAVGHRFVIGHQGGIVISPDAVIGDDCVIRQNVTIGATTGGGSAPRIGREVEIGAGAVLLGGITVGDRAIIGPNAVVTTDVPDGARVVAPPARILPGPAGARQEPVDAVSGAPTAALDGGVDELTTVIREALALEHAIEADTPLLSSGLIDSLNVAILLEALEARYGVTVPPEAAAAEAFDTPSQILDYLRSST